MIRATPGPPCRDVQQATPMGHRRQLANENRILGLSHLLAASASVNGNGGSFLWVSL